MATPVSDSIPLTGTAFVDGLTQGGSWSFAGPRVLTYSFNQNFDLGPDGTIIGGPGGPWTQPFMDAFARAAAAWSNVANIGFQLVSSGTYTLESTADIAATLSGDDLSEVGGAAIGIPPDADIANELLAAIGITRGQYPNPEGDVFFDNFYQGYQYLYDGGFGFEAMVHELGHALGLKHPDDDGANGRPTFLSLGISQYDNERNTIMSTAESGTLSAGNDATPMPLDILAIQHIYGANMTYHAGDDTYSIVADSNAAQRTIWDAGGTDTIDASTLIGATIDLRPGVGFAQASSSGYTAIAYNVTIEKAIGGAGSDTLTGNDAANTLDGGGGIDTMRGGPGDDTYLVDNLADSIAENPGEGTDTIVAAASVTLPAEVENLTLAGNFAISGTGNALANYILGNSAVNNLAGGGGNDVLDGGAGIDVMQGGPGDDAYYVDSAAALGGTFLSLNWFGTNYTFTPATGTFNVTASDYAQDADSLVDTVTLFYNEPQNFPGHSFSVDLSTRMLDVPLAMGTYTDAMRYPFETSGHPGLWIAGDGSGANTSTGAFTVTAASFTYGEGQAQVAQFVANFTYSGDGGPTVIGTLSINGPSGVQTDAVIEAPGEGTDTVRSVIDYALPANVEILELLGSNPINGAGNDLNNWLVGNDAPNILDGGTGNDAMLGGKDDDTYYVDSPFDVVVEATSEGTDEVRSTINHALAANVENLVLLGAAAIGTGNAAANLLAGSAASNLLDGAAGNDTLDAGNGNDSAIGGAGDDSMVGGAGIDTAQFPGARSGYAIVKSAGVTSVSGPDGTDSLTGFERLQFADGIVRIGGPAIVDFSGETKTDLVLRHDAGKIEYRLMDGTTLAGYKDDPIPTYWKIISTDGDFNGDGKSDVVIRHDNGTIEYRLMDGVNLAGYRDDLIPTYWHIVSTDSDFNGDGKSDVVIRHDNSTIEYRLMDGPDLAAYLDDPIPTYWKIVSTDSDFNGDGKSDLVIRHDNGTIEYRLMDGTNLADYLDDPIPTYWKIVSTDSDFNGDGKSDVVLRHDNGTIEYRLMDGTNLVGYLDDPIPTYWKIVSADSDFNGDGKSDVVLRHDNGTIEYRLMDGTNLIGYKDDPIPLYWKIVSTDSDFNGDGKSDVVLRHDNGTIEYRLMDGVDMTAFLDDPIPSYWSVFNNEPPVLAQ